MKVKMVVKKRLLSILLCTAMVCGFIPQGETVTFAADNEVNLEGDLKAVQITLEATDGNSYTMEELEANSSLKVKKGAGIVIELSFDTISQVSGDAALVYELPENLLDDSEADADGILYSGTVDDTDAKTKAGNWTLDKNGKLTVTLDSEFYNEHKNDDNTIDLHGFYFKFTGNLSDARDENNAVLSFRGMSATYTIPFEDEEETVNIGSAQASTSVRKAASANTASAIDIKDYLQSVAIIITDKDGNKSSIEDLPADSVAKGAAIELTLTFNTIKGLHKGQTMTYKLPDNLLDGSKANKNTGILYSGTVDDSQEKIPAASWEIDKDGVLTLTLLDSYFDANQHDSDGTVDIHGFFFTFNGNLSQERGETSGNDDNVLVFKGTSDQTTGDYIRYIIPFEYYNEHAQVKVEKTNTFDPATRKITYTITATAPDTNTYDVTNLTITDSFSDTSKDYVTNTYQNIQASSGTSYSNGTWTIGTLTKGQSATLTYTAEVKTNYFTTENAAITNTATATYNADGKVTANNTLENAGTLLITKSTPTPSYENGKAYLTYGLKVTAAGAAATNIVVKDVFNHTDAISTYTKVSASQGDITTKDDPSSTTGGKTMEWNVGSLAKDASATLTYKVEVKGTAWDNYSSKQSNGSLQLELKNTAGVYVRSGSEDIKYNEATVTYKMTKTLLTKTGSAGADGITYTVKVNDPSSQAMNSNISYIQDTLSAGKYTSANVTVTVYKADGAKEGTYTVPIDKIKTGDRSWKIDLTNMYDATTGTTVNKASTEAAPYYYELSYTAYALGYINNTAGVGYGGASGDKYEHTVTYGAGTTNFKYNKKVTDFGINDGYAKWKVTINSTIPANSGIEDTLSDNGGKHGATCGAKTGCVYYTEDQINNLVVKFGETTLVKGTDYTILEMSRHDDDIAGKYHGFKIKFLHEIAATDDKPVTIEYTSSFGEEEVYTYHAGYTWENYNTSKFCYAIGTDNETSEQEQKDYVTFDPGNNNLSKTYIGYDESTGEMIWYMLVNMNSLISGEATITEYIPYGQTYSSSNIIYAEKGAWYTKALYLDKEGGTLIASADNPNASGPEAEFFKNIFNKDAANQIAYTGAQAKNVSIKSVDETGTWTDEAGHTCQKVVITLDGLKGFDSFVESGAATMNGKTTSGGANWPGLGKFTIRVKTKLSGDDLMAINAGDKKTYTNRAVFESGDAYIRGNDKTADGTVGKIEKLLTKAEMLQEGPAYVEYAMDINQNSLDLMSGDDPLTVVDIMEKGMSLATDHVVSTKDDTPQYFDVYDVSEMEDAALYTTDNKGHTVLDTDNIRKKGTQLTTADYTLEDITGEEVEGMDAADVGKPAYKVTVPDGKHIIILYWVTVEGSLGETVNTSNKVNFFYQGKMNTNTSSAVDSKVVVSEAFSGLFTGAYFKLKKTDPSGEALEGAEFTMYKYVENGPDEVYMTATTSENGVAYFGHRAEETNGEAIMKDTLYYLVETKAPEGYALDSTPYYFEFKTAGKDPLTVDGAEVHQLITGGTITLVNEYIETSQVYSERTDPSEPTKTSNTSEPTKTSNPVRVTENGPGTGDRSNVFLWMALMLVTCCGLVGIFTFKKRRKTK